MDMARNYGAAVMLDSKVLYAGGGGSGFIPIPERLTLCGLPEALSATVRLALRLPVAAGVKVTLMVQLELGPSVDGYMGQLLVWPKSALMVPVKKILVMVSGALPVFESVTA